MGFSIGAGSAGYATPSKAKGLGMRDLIHDAVVQSQIFAMK